MKEKRGGRGLYLLIGAGCMLVSGIIYAWSVLKAPFSEEFGWTLSQLSVNFTLTMCFFCLGGLLAGIWTKRSRPRAPLLCAALLTAAGFLGVSRMSGESVLALYFFYGMALGLGIGMAYNVVVACISAWFPDKKGACTGILMMSFGASTLTLGYLAAELMAADLLGWRGVYGGLGILLAAVLLLAGLILKRPEGEPLDFANSKEEYTTRQMIRRPSFHRFFLFLLTLAAVGNTVISFAYDFSLSMGAKGALGTLMVGVLSLCNGLGRIASGLVFDSAGCKKSMLLANLLAIGSAVLLLFSVWIRSLPLGLLGLCAAGISYGFAPTVSSVFIADSYGMKHFSMNFSVANLMLIPASFMATLAGLVQTHTQGYAAPFALLLVCGSVSLLANLSMKKP